MQINIISVGKIKESYFEEAIKEYEKRIKKYAKINFIVHKDEAIRDNNSDEQIKNIEGNRILESIKSGYNIVLDLKGEGIDSVKMAKKIEDIFLYQSSNINFIIGGSLGLSNKVLEMADYHLCFSKMTFPHQLMKVILLEQIYRAFKILNNETYHK